MSSRQRRRAVAAMVLLPLLAAVACNAINGSHDRFIDEGDATTTSTTPGDSSSSSDATSPGSPDGQSDAGADAGDGAIIIVGCESSRGPKMVHIDDVPNNVHFCIDSTEVSGADYLAFVNATTAAELTSRAATFPLVCQQLFTPPFTVNGVLQTSNVIDGPRAVTMVGWCQAHAYCAWAGKRLCGTLNGGLPHELHDPAETIEWFFACTRGQARRYPYGATAVPGICNTGLPDGGDAPVEAVHNRPACVGGYDGIFDMQGNVREWESGWQDDASIPGYVSARGVGFSDSYDSDCTTTGGNPATFYYQGGLDTVGIRCCASP